MTQRETAKELIKVFESSKHLTNQILLEKIIGMIPVAGLKSRLILNVFL